MLNAKRKTEIYFAFKHVIKMLKKHNKCNTKDKHFRFFFSVFFVTLFFCCHLNTFTVVFSAFLSVLCRSCNGHNLTMAFNPFCCFLCLRLTLRLRLLILSFSTLYMWLSFLVFISLLLLLTSSSLPTFISFLFFFSSSTTSSSVIRFVFSKVCFFVVKLNVLHFAS